MILNEVRILGLKVHNVTMAEALSFVDEALEKEELSRIITLNAEIAYGAHDDEKQIALINDADLVTPDGSGIIWAANRYGTPLKERVCGIDLFTAMMERYQDGSHGFYFLGAKPEVAEIAAKKIRSKYPNLRFCGYHDGYFGKENSEAMAKEIKESGAEILIAAMGAPFQDLWIAEYGEACGAKVAIGVGGSLDVISGTVKRAPKLVRKLRLEWLYRVLKDLSRWRRVLVLPKFMSLVKKQCK